MAKILSLPDTNQNTKSLRLGDRLLNTQSITSDHLQIALHEQRRSGEQLGQILVRMGFLNDHVLAETLAIHMGHDAIKLKNIAIDPEAVRHLPRAIALRCRALPISFDATTLHLAVADPHDIGAMDEIRRYFPRHIDLVPMIEPAADIIEAIETHIPVVIDFDAILHELEGIRTVAADENDDHQHPVVRLVNSILTNAVHEGASDIHLEPESNFIRVRLRIDGVLRQQHALHRSHWSEISHRLKIMATMNIADTRSIQDGRFQMAIGNAMIDFRMAIMPTIQGENIVIRILDHRRALLPLEKLGYDRHALHQIDALMQRPEGVTLVTGPTGCGKTTSLYAMLKRLNSVDVNIMTLEEPVEYQFELMRQTAVQENHGMSFADGVRGILRQAPDIIFIGEIRDDDTARMAMRAAMTGHQVFSTLHCNDSFGALSRLKDLGLTPSMMAENINGIIAQRLVRKLCAHCKTTRIASDQEKALLYREPENVASFTQGFAETQSLIETPPLIGQAVGCVHCHGTGYRGRAAITEIIRVTPAMDELIAAGAPRTALRLQTRKDGFRSMAEDGIEKILRHETTFDEVRRAVDLSRSL